LSQLIVVPEEAEKIREVFRLYIEEKMPPQKISDRLGFKGDKQIRDILTRKSLTGCIIYLGEEYKGQHEAIISLERWQEAQDELEKRSVHRAESNYLLSGLLVCGQCGAKMRYQKWNKNGECKLICYSKQKSKPNLVKTDDCDSEYFWATDVENAVVSELFRMTYLGNEDVKKSAATIDPSEALAKELKTAKQKLSRLYDFEDGEDDVLADKIYALKERIKQLQIQLNDEEAKKRISRKIEKAKSIFRSLESTWPHMTDKERQSVCQELIDRVVIHKDGVIDVHLKLRSYLVNK
jgi:site-specific DNA recombinase